MMKNIDFEKDQIILEFGTGDGCMTDAIRSGMVAGSRLVSFELNDDFYNYARDKFRTDPRVELHQDNALNFDDPVYLGNHTEVDYVVSSLPLTLFKQSDVRKLLTKVRARLKPGGKFIQYQYSLGKLGDLKKIFSHVSLDYTLLNIPPAFVYTCTK